MLPGIGEGGEGLQSHVARVMREHGGAPSLSDWEQLARSTLEAEGLGDDAADFFTLNLARLPFETKEELIEKRRRILSLHLAGTALQEEFPNVTIRREAQLGVHGFATMQMPFSQYGQTADEIYSSLLYTTTNLQLREGFSGSEVHLPSSYISEDVLRSTSRQLADPRALTKGKRLIFDVESAGLEKTKGVWQVSARLMEGERELNAVNLIFDNPNMDLGLSRMDGQPMTLKDFVKAKVQSQPGSRATMADDFVSGMDEFLDLVDQADTLVAQNAKFDVGMLEYALNQAGGDDAFKGKVSRFLQKAKSDKMVDTRLFTIALLGGEGLEVDPSIVGMGKVTPFSMENIFLQTDFLERVAANASGGWDEVMGLLEQGVHYGDVDTFFEDQLFQMQLKALDDPTQMLRPTSLGAGRARTLVERSASLTPFTKIPGLDGQTPLEHLVMQTRRLDDFTPGDHQKAMFKGGMFKRWTAQVVDRGVGGFSDMRALVQGDYARIEGLTDIEAGRSVQELAERAHIPFSGLSSVERALSTSLNQITGAGGGVFGDLTGATRIQMADAGSVEQMLRTSPRSVSLPMGVIEAAEREGVIGTRASQALGTQAEAVQLARWSVIHKRDGTKGLSLMLDMFQDADEIEHFTQWLSNIPDTQLEEMGLRPKQIAEIASRIERTGLQYGVQIGTLEGDEADLRRTARIFEDLNAATDKADRTTIRSMLFRGTGDEVLAGPAIMDVGGIFDDVDNRFLGQLQDLQGMYRHITDTASEDRVLQHAVSLGGRSGRAENLYQGLRRFVDAKGPRITAGIGIGLIAGYYTLRDSEEEDLVNQTFAAPTEFESRAPDISANQMSAPPQPRMGAGRSGLAPLSTAGTVQWLNYEKIGHHRMGPNKDSHLFAGV